MGYFVFFRKHYLFNVVEEVCAKNLFPMFEKCVVPLLFCEAGGYACDRRRRVAYSSDVFLQKIKRLVTSVATTTNNTFSF